MKLLRILCLALFLMFYPSQASGTDTLLNINIATFEQLKALPGIGPVKAQAILDYRNANGDFRGLEDLDKVTGIGPITLAALEPLVTFTQEEHENTQIDSTQP